MLFPILFMSNIPKEVRKLKKSLENQARELLKEARTDFNEKRVFYDPEKCVNQFMAMYYSLNRMG